MTSSYDKKLTDLWNWEYYKFPEFSLNVENLGLHFEVGPIGTGGDGFHTFHAFQNRWNHLFSQLVLFSCTINGESEYAIALISYLKMLNQTLDFKWTI